MATQTELLERQEAATVELETLKGILHQFLHGTAVQTVTTEAGVIPTLSGLVEEIRQRVGARRNPISYSVHDLSRYEENAEPMFALVTDTKLYFLKTLANSYFRLLTAPSGASIVFTLTINGQAFSIIFESGSTTGTVVGVASDLEVPAGSLITLTLATPVVMYFHQSLTGNRNNPMSESRWTNLRQAFSDRGYILVSVDDQGDRWGNRLSMRNHANALRWLRKHVNVGKVFVLGYSMGGMAALNAVANRALGPVAAAALICPVCDMSLLYDNASYTSVISSSWNVSSKAELLLKTKGFNPLFTNPAKFAKIPYVFNVATNDPNVDPANNAIPFEAAIRSVAKSTAINTLGTGHGAPATFDVASIAGLFDANK